MGSHAPGEECLSTETVLRWITNPQEAVLAQSCTTHAHALAKRQVQVSLENLEMLQSVGAGSLTEESEARSLHQAKLCVAEDAWRVAKQREFVLRHEIDQAPGGDGSTWESVPLVLHGCVTPGLDALLLAVEMNCDLRAKSAFTVTDPLTGQLRHSGLGNIIQLETMRRHYGAHLNINGLDLNCDATSIGGENVNLADFMLGK